MLLTSTQLVWLRQSLVPLASDHDLERAYDFEHALNQRRQLERVFTFEPRGSQGHQFRWWVLFFCGSARSLTQDNAPVSRSIIGGTKLIRSAGTGLVAYNERIDLEQTFHGQGFSTALYKAEEQLYKNWKVQEVHLTALGVGRTVWLKPKFGFSPVRPGMLAESFKEWAHKHRVSPEVPSAPHLYPPAFLDQLSELKLFKVLR